MSNADKITQILTTAQNSLTAAFPDPAPVPVLTPTPTPTPTPPPAPTPAPSPSGATLLLQNMTEVTPGVYKSNSLASLLKCYAQFRTPQPANYIKLSGYRTTNVPTADTPGVFLNDKRYRAWPDSGNNDEYLGRGWSMVNGKPVADGAWKFTVENPTSNIGWFSIPDWKALNVRVFESYEVDYSARTVKIQIGATMWSASGVTFGTSGRTQFGMQEVISSDPAPIGLPSDAYCNFDSLAFSWR